MEEIKEALKRKYERSKRIDTRTRIPEVNRASIYVRKQRTTKYVLLTLIVIPNNTGHLCALLRTIGYAITTLHTLVRLRVRMRALVCARIAPIPRKRPFGKGALTQKAKLLLCTRNVKQL